MLNASELGRRLRAARVLAGYENRDEFALALGRFKGQDGPIQGFGGGTVRDTEGGARTIKPTEADAVAEFCGLPRSFFTADRARLGPVDGEAPEDIANRLDRIERLLSGEDGGSRGDATP